MVLEKPLLDSPLVLLHHLPFVTASEVDKGHGIAEKRILHFSIEAGVGGEAWRVVYLPGGVLIHPVPRPPKQAWRPGDLTEGIVKKSPPAEASAKEAGCF